MTDKEISRQARDKKTDIAKREEEVLAFWNENKIFEKSVECPAGACPTPDGVREYTFYDGPPFATGAPHYGHLLQSFVKDAVPRYKTMRGYRVKRQWGWDCHGLPIENIVEKELGISGREEVLKIGIKKFNDTCREKIFEYADIWEKVIPRIGRWADMENAYKTMDTDYMESEWWAFKELYDKGLVYEDYRSIHICPRCETTLSQSEVTEGYKDIKDLSVTVKFELVDEPNTFVLAWTTTPWTLPGNVALAVGPDIEYVKVESEEEKYILAKKKVEEVFEGKEYKVVEDVKMEDLIGKVYTPPFNYYIEDTSIENKENGWKIYAADFVTDEDGTGVAHEAPAFGADDLALAQSVGLPVIQHVSIDGKVKQEVTDFAGLHVKEKDNHQATDIEIIKYLAHNGLLFDKKKIEHSYPHCWRCDTPLLNYATTSWFVAVEKMKKDLLEYAKGINWSPKHIKEGRWGNWLEGARDWSISRNRFWANTMPVWRCEKEGCDAETVVGSIDELEELSGVRVNDLHKDVVDEVMWKCSCGGEMRRIPDVLDTWFNSGSVPYSTLHYPFENKEEFEKRMPVDFIAEAQDQTRAWFYYQHVLAGGLFGSRAFNNCIVTGMVLAEDGKKMSKKLQNYPDPMYMIDTYGADAMRLYILSSPVVRTEALNFSEKEVGEVARKIFGRLVNVYEFYALYKDDPVRTDGSGEPTSNGVNDSDKSEHVLDKWIIARLRQLHGEVTEAMENYELDKATRPFADFVDDLSTWYVRRSRDRYKGEDEGGKREALETTRFVLRKLSKLLAPFAPFHGDWLWQQTKRSGDAESVHLTNWCSSREYDVQVLEEMSEVRKVVSLALDARKEADVKVRQPLASLKFSIFNFQFSKNKEQLFSIIADEVNVKEVISDENLDKDVELDLNITPELKEEGDFRELLRGIQAERKKANLKPGDMTKLKITAPKETQELARKYQDEIIKQAFVSEFEFEDGEFDVEVF